MHLRITDVSIPAEGVWLDARLAHAPNVIGLAMILLPGTGCRTLAPDDPIAAALHKARLATLVLDLLTQREDAPDSDAHYNIPQMGNRLLAVSEWITHQPALNRLALGLVGSGTASAAAVRAAWKLPGRFAAIVCRAGRPDLAGAIPLRALTTPIRFMVGAADPAFGTLDRAYELISAERDWQLVPQVGEDADDPAMLARFGALAADWLALKLPPPATESAEVDVEPA